MRWQKGGVAICLGLIWLGWGQLSQAADEPQAREIVDRVARLYISQSSIATVEMQITKENWHRKILMQFWSLGESNILVRVRSPQEDAGAAILKVGNQTWCYLPKANRTVRMPASMMLTPWMGSDFTLNDLVKQSRLTDDYDIAISSEGQRDGVAVSEYTLTPKPEAAPPHMPTGLPRQLTGDRPSYHHFMDGEPPLAGPFSLFGGDSPNRQNFPLPVPLNMRRTCNRGGERRSRSVRRCSYRWPHK